MPLSGREPDLQRLRVETEHHRTVQQSKPRPPVLWLEPAFVPSKPTKLSSRLVVRETATNRESQSSTSIVKVCSFSTAPRRYGDADVHGLLPWFPGRHLEELNTTAISSAQIDNFKTRTPSDTRQQPERTAFSLKKTRLPIVERFRRALGSRVPTVVLLPVPIVDGVSSSPLLPKRARLGRGVNRPPLGHGALRSRSCRQSTAVLRRLDLFVPMQIRWQRMYLAHTGSEGYSCCIERGRASRTVATVSQFEFRLLHCAPMKESKSLLSRRSVSGRVCGYSPKLQRGRINGRSRNRRSHQLLGFLSRFRCETVASDVSPVSSAQFALPLLPLPVDVAPLLLACAKLPLDPTAQVRAIPVHQESTVRDTPPANHHNPWPVPPLGIHPVHLATEGGRIWQTNGDETLARMLCSRRWRSARKKFFAVRTEQSAVAVRNLQSTRSCLERGEHAR
jgi:hypothetical protein